jgi:hypothetical protein
MHRERYAFDRLSTMIRLVDYAEHNNNGYPELNGQPAFKFDKDVDVLRIYCMIQILKLCTKEIVLPMC